MRLLGFASAGLGGLLAARLLGRWALELVASAPGRVEDAVALAGSTLGTFLALWYALTAVTLVVAELATSSRRLLGLAGVLHQAVGRMGAPVLRRAAVLGLGAGLTFGAAPALATDVPRGAPSSDGAVALAASAGSVHERVPLTARVARVDDAAGASRTAGTGAASSDGEVPADLRPGTSSWSRPAGSPHDAETARATAPVSETRPDSTPGGAPPISEPSTGGTAHTSPTGPPPSDDGTDRTGTDRPGASPSAATAATAPHFRTVGRPEPVAAAGSAAHPGPAAGTTTTAGSAPATGLPATGSTTAEPAAVADPHADGSAESSTYVVREGDTLWEIASAHLGAGAPDAAVAREWPRWHAVNIAVIGDDPDLIHPGQTLLVPDAKDS